MHLWWPGLSNIYNAIHIIQVSPTCCCSILQKHKFYDENWGKSVKYQPEAFYCDSVKFFFKCGCSLSVWWIFFLPDPFHIQLDQIESFFDQIQFWNSKVVWDCKWGDREMGGRSSKWRGFSNKTDLSHLNSFKRSLNWQAAHRDRLQVLLSDTSEAAGWRFKF